MNNCCRVFSTHSFTKSNRLLWANARFNPFPSGIILMRPRKSDALLPVSMKRCLGGFLFLLCLWTGRARAETALPETVLRAMPPLHGQLDLRSTPFFPSVGRKTVMWTYLPPGYFDAKNAGKRFPVVYLLHGEPGTWTDCFLSGRVEVMADKLISQGRIEPLILVCLDGSGPNGPRDFTNFCDRPDGYRTEEMIARELVPAVDRTFRTVPDADHRALWGYSAGGYGALNIGFHFPNTFHVLESHAGFYQPSGDAKIMRRVLGEPSRLWNENSPLLTVKTLPERAPLHVYLDDSPASPDYSDFQEMAARLKEKQIDLDLEVYPRVHAWSLIQQRCADSLTFASRSFELADLKDKAKSVVFNAPVTRPRLF